MKIIITSRFQSPVGEMILGSIGNKLCMCDWAASTRHQSNLRRICHRLNANVAEGTSAIIDMAVEQLDQYFAGKRREFSIPVELCGTAFQCLVWSELLKQPYGSNISYVGLAHHINHPKAVRAVANAIAANPISIIVPCHRVTGSDGNLTGYAGGLPAKRTLLMLESSTK